jgi:hypothetical protein
MKKLFLFLSIATLALGSCSKKEDEVPVPVTVCFDAAYDGTYNGKNSSTTGLINVVLKKIDCSILTISSDKLAGGAEKKVIEIKESAPGSYVGKLEGGGDVTIGFGKNDAGVATVSIVATGYCNFTGTKQ